MKNFDIAVEKIKDLEKYDKYEAALIFGSYARDTVNEDSDIDTVVVCDQDKKNTILHPYVGDVKLDLSYYSFEQLKDKCDKEVDKREREPMIARSLILFDKTGELTSLVKELNKITPGKWTNEMEADQRFLMYHANDKVVRNLEKDPISSLFSMSIGVNDLLKTHYLINEKWWLSNKKLLSDLSSWDKKMYELLVKFLELSEVEEKYSYWKKIYEYILEQIGGSKPLDEKIPSEFIEDINLIVN